MKKTIVLIIMFLFFVQYLFAQQCRTPFASTLYPAQSPPSGLVNQTPCSGYSVFYPSGTQKTTIGVNYIFLKPLSGQGKWDTVTQASCEAQLKVINYYFDNLKQPNKVIPNPPIFLNTAKIEFTFKSIQKIAHASYSNSPHFGGFNSDQNAINIIFGCHPTVFGYGAAGGIKSNELFIVDTLAIQPYTMIDSAGLRLIAHELGHCLGLIHTGPTIVLNPNGNILGSFPFNDYWLEDTLTWNTSNSGNNIMSYCWGCNEYLSPNQIYTIHRNLLLDPLVKKLPTSHGNYGCAADHNNDWDISGVDTLTGSWLNPPGNLTIKSGSDITLTSCLKMAVGAKIIIEPGARFTVSGGNIMTQCYGRWEGIEIRSSVGAIQAFNSSNPNLPASNIGMLRLYNAGIYNAVTAVTVGERNTAGNYVAGTGGGILFSENTNYINNITAVKFNAYLLVGSDTDNLSYFKRDTFVVNVDYILGNNPIASVLIDRTEKIDFLGCYFEELPFITSTAIKCMDGSIRVKDHCTSISGGNCIGILTQNTFIGFKRAISIGASFNKDISTIDHVFIDQEVVRHQAIAAWNNLEGGIYVSNSFGTQITNCSIETVKKITTSLPANYGIYLDNCDGYVIENNLLDSHYPLKTIGICVNNSGPNANSIYNNVITDHDQGIWTQDINYHQVTGAGLRLNCNDFTGCKYNIGVQGTEAFGCIAPCLPVYNPAGIAKTQGIADLVNLNKNVRNTYSTLNCTTNGENKFYINTPNGFVVTSHGSFNNPTFHPVPQLNNSCSDSAKVILSYGTTPVGGKAGYCTVGYMPSFSSSQLTERITDSRTKRAEYTLILANNVDNGNTGYLLDEIYNTTVDENDLKDLLVTADFLSDTVLHAYFMREDVQLSNATVIFSKNAPLNLGLWQKVSEKGIDSYGFNTWDSIQQRTRLSDRSLIENELSMAYTDLGLFTNEKIRRFLSEENPVYDSIIKIYQYNELPNSQIKLAETYIAADLIANANNLISEMDDAAANYNICKLLSYAVNLKTVENYEDTLRADSSIYYYLIDVATGKVALEEGYSKNLLESVYGYRIDEIRLSPLEENFDERRSTLNSQENVENKDIITEKGIRIYPNPASEKLMIELESTDSYRIVFSDLSGRKILEQACNSNCSIQLNILQNGVYLLNLYKEGAFVCTRKIVIIK